MTIDDRVTERPAVGSRYCLTIETPLVLLAMTFKARKQRTVDRAELRAAMFQVTINTFEPGLDVWLNHRWDERLGDVARGTLCKHAAAQ